MENKNMYAFIARIALEYRLSLGNICKLLSMEPNDQNKLKAYELIMSTVHGDDLRLAYDFLFNYETINEDEFAASKAFTKAVIFIKRYNNAQKTGDKEQVKLVVKELSKTDENFEVVRKKNNFVKMSEEDALAISKYRLKYCVSKLRMSESLEVSSDLITRNEDKLSDSKLKEKLKLVSDFYESLYIRNKKPKR